MTRRRTRYANAVRAVIVLLAVCVLSCPGWTQSAQPQAAAVSMPGLYLHFLEYLSHLDADSLVLKAKGKNGYLMQSSMQKQMGFNDADFAILRASSAQVAAMSSDWNARMAALGRSGPPTAAGLEQFKVLLAERDADASAVMTTLRQQLPPGKIQKFEAFLQQLPLPKTILIHPGAGQTAPAGVQP